MKRTSARFLRSPLSPLLCWGLCIIATIGFSPGVNAFVLIDADDLFCTVDLHWETHGCKSSTCTVHNESFTDLCSENNTSAEESAMAWGFWMWVRENALKHQNFWNQTVCSNSFDLSDGQNDVDWRSSLPGSDIGHAWWDDTDVCGFDGHDHIQEVDIGLLTPHDWADNDEPVFGNQHATFQACAYDGDFREDVAAHEMGHAYGIWHNDAIATTMNSSGPARGCNMASGFHTQPDEDSQRGAVEFHGRNTNNIRNASAMIWYKDPVIGVTKTHIDNLNYCGASFTYTVTLMSYYASISSTLYRVMLVPEGVPPSFNPGNFITVQIINPGSSFSGRFTSTFSLSSLHTLLTPGVIYRLWIQADYTNLVNESDEGDNVIPFDIRLKRGAGC